MSMGKKIVVLGALGALSFAGAFGVSYFFGGSPPAGEPVVDGNDPLVGGAPAAQAGMSLSALEKLRPDEAKVDEILRLAQQAKDDLARRTGQVEAEEQRIEMMRGDLERQAQELEQLRLQMAEVLREVRKERALLEQSRVRIALEEMDNLKRTAEVYEKMSPTEAAEVLMGMAKNGQVEDAAKILHAMTVRGAGKVMGKITDPALTAQLSDRMKRVRTEE